jgi:hypothetical protein
LWITRAGGATTEAADITPPKNKKPGSLIASGSSSQGVKPETLPRVAMKQLASSAEGGRSSRGG